MIMRYHNYHDNVKPRTLDVNESLAHKFTAKDEEMMDFIESYKARVERGEMPATQSDVSITMENGSVAMALPHRLPL
jgi:hypothetical protein